jgi:predicted extracellular nuclease
MRRPLAAVTGAVLGLSMVPLTATGSAAATATELFFSEYVEGSSNNKAVEIYNGTGAVVDLDGYNVQQFSNGNSSAGLTLQLEGELSAGDVYVVAHSSADPAIRDVADQTTGAGLFNGDDALVLRNGTEVLDVIGQVGFDPGTEWGTGLTSTADNTLRRKSSVSAGDTNGADAFDPAVEWNGFAVNTFDGLGWHGDVPPTVRSTFPWDGRINVAPDGDLTVTFSEPVTVEEGAFVLTCGGAAVDLAVTGGPTSYSLDPATDLPYEAACTLTVDADHVQDQDEDIDPMAADHVVDFTVAQAGPVCEWDYTPTYDIQGDGSATGLSEDLNTAGVVVGDYEQGGLRGFYVQDLQGDGDPSTSDGVFVFNGNEDEVSVGDVVRVAGTPSEFQGQTQVSAYRDGVTVCGSDASVAPTEVSLPFASEADRERYEGMLVELPQTLSVTELFQLGRFGQVMLSSGGRLAQPTNVVEPGAEANNLQAVNDLNQILVDDALQSQNPDPIPFARDGAPLTAANTLRGGDTATGTVGVMTYTWGGNSASPNDYRVRPINALDGFVDFEAVNQRTEAPDAVGGDLRVASFNVLNYFNTFGDVCRGGVEGEVMECRGADDAFELERQADKIVAALAGLDADVVGVIEIENDGYGPASALQDLVNRLNEATAPGTYAFVDADQETGEVDVLGDDAIKVGMLYKPSVVEPVGTAVLNTDSFVNGASGEPRNRPALAQSFEEVDGAGTFTAVVNHLKSKGSDCNADGDPDTGDGQGNCNLTRLESAQELAAWLAGDPTGVDDADVLVMGDLNSYAKEDPITALKEAGYKDLVRRFEGKGAYSYVFDGQWGYLDHALASPQLAQQVTGTTTWHINADEPPVLDYNTDFKSAAQVGYLYDDSPYRSSDHDPVLVGLDLAPSKPGADKTGR